MSCRHSCSPNTGCRMSNIIVNHLLFADDAVIFAPSSKGLQQLLDICSEFAATHNVVFNVKKSQCLIVASKNNVITRPNFQLCGAGLPYADSYTYLGHIISSDLYLIMLILCVKLDVYMLEQITLFGNLTVLYWILNLCCSEPSACQFMAVSCGVQCHNMLTTNCMLLIMMVLDNFWTNVDGVVHLNFLFLMMYLCMLL